MLGGIGMPELLLIFLVVILLFGAKKLPEFAKGLAQALKVLKKEAHNIQQDLDVNEAIQASTNGSDTKKDTSNDFDPAVQKRDWRPKSDNDSIPKKT